MSARTKALLLAVATPSATVLAAAAIAALVFTSFTPNTATRTHRLPTPLGWFGTPGSELSIAVTLGLLATAIALHRRRRRGRKGIPIATIAVLFTVAAILALSAFWQCHNWSHPAILTPLLLTAGVIKGAVGDQSITSGTTCPAFTPAGLDVARVCAIAGIFVSITGAAAALFHPQADRIRVRLARRVVVIVGIDDDSLPLVVAVAHATEQRTKVVLVTSKPDRDCVKAARRTGVAVIAFEMQEADGLEHFSFWHKMIRLYLLSPGPALNIVRLTAITSAIARGNHRRIPLIIRVDNPWQARAWRKERAGGTSQCWAPDTVGLYEVTACRLVEAVLAERSIENLVVAGTSPLTLAICMEFRRRQIERHFHRQIEGRTMPALTLVGPQSSTYVADFASHENAQRGPCPVATIAIDDRALGITTLAETVEALSAAAVIIVESPVVSDTTLGTRVAARFPSTPVYEFDPAAHPLGAHTPVIGRLRSFTLSMNLPTGVGHDIWERIARLKHEIYAQGTSRDTPATLPWDELDEFYRASNRREIRNALWMVERIAGHTWSPPPPTENRGPLDPPVVDDAIELFRSDLLFSGADPIADKALAFSVLHALEFDDAAIEAMARAEHEDWMRLYESAGWTAGERDDRRKRRPNLVEWSKLNEAYRSTSLKSLATTVILLRGLGYRSRPLWQRYQRTGQVHAQRKWRAWTWTTADGQQLCAQPGDWKLRELGDQTGHGWSVRNNIFGATYTYKRGDVWERTGTVLARRAEPGEPIETFEGQLTATRGDWVVQGERGEFWTVSDDKFRKHYLGPVTDTIHERRQSPNDLRRMFGLITSSRTEPSRNSTARTG